MKKIKFIFFNIIIIIFITEFFAFAGEVKNALTQTGPRITVGRFGLERASADISACARPCPWVLSATQALHVAVPANAAEVAVPADAAETPYALGAWCAYYSEAHRSPLRSYRLLARSRPSSLAAPPHFRCSTSGSYS